MTEGGMATDGVASGGVVFAALIPEDLPSGTNTLRLVPGGWSVSDMMTNGKQI